MPISNEKTILLGAEHDAVLREALVAVLRELGAEKPEHEWAVAGSQELEQLEVTLGAQRLRIVSETYVGLSLTGPAELVDLISAKVRSACERSRR